MGGKNNHESKNKIALWNLSFDLLVVVISRFYLSRFCNEGALLCPFNLLLGFTGLLSFGHAAFFGTAAYITAYFCKEAGLSPELGIILGVVGSGILGF